VSELQITARMKIHDGKLEEFKRVAERCMESARTKDTGTLQYDWFFDADQRECVVRERYRDSAALMEHMANLGDASGALLQTCDFSAEIYGTPSAEIVAGLRGFDITYYTHYQSI